MSKELEALKRLEQETCPATYMPDFNKLECVDIVRKALEDYEKKCEILSILKRTKVNLYDEVYGCEDYEEYLELFTYAQDSLNLTEKEFYLLKQWING